MRENIFEQIELPTPTLKKNCDSIYRKNIATVQKLRNIVMLAESYRKLNKHEEICLASECGDYLEKLYSTMNYASLILFTSAEYTDFLNKEEIRQSMDGKARWVDNVIIERWFRSLKCDDIYINEYDSPQKLRAGISGYISDYNIIRPHQTFDYLTPMNVYTSKKVA